MVIVGATLYGCPVWFFYTIGYKNRPYLLLFINPVISYEQAFHQYHFA